MKADPTGAQLPVFLSANNLRPFISIELAAALSAPLMYITQTGQRAHGIRADLIPEVLDVWLKADEAGNVLTEAQKRFAHVAQILMRGLAKTGIIALIDEATGFQSIRPADALTRILEAFITKELRKWVRTFPRSFFEEMCRLRGLQLRDDMKLPRTFGKVINDVVYDRLAPAVRQELERKNPVLEETGRRRHKHHQWLTQHIGNPKLLHHLGLLEGMARGFDDGDWEGFYSRVNRVLPPYDPLPLFEMQVEGDEVRMLPASTSGTERHSVLSLPAARE